MNIFKRIKGIVVTAYAKRVYAKVVRMANEKYDKEHKIQFAFSPYGKDILIVNSNEFVKYKSKMNIYGSLYTTPQLRKGCWYHTPNGDGTGAMTAFEIEVRKTAFIRHFLTKAGL